MQPPSKHTASNPPIMRVCWLSSGPIEFSPFRPTKADTLTGKLNPELLGLLYLGTLLYHRGRCPPWLPTRLWHFPAWLVGLLKKIHMPTSRTAEWRKLKHLISVVTNLSGINCHCNQVGIIGRTGPQMEDQWTLVTPAISR